MKNYILFITLILLASCQSSPVFDECLSTESRSEDKVKEYDLLSAEEAYKIAWEFRNSLDSCKKQNIEYDFESAEISVIPSMKQVSRSTGVYVHPDSMMYLINFPANTGFALLGTDRRIDKNVLAISNTGRLNLTYNGQHAYTEYNIGVVTYIDFAEDYLNHTLNAIVNPWPDDDRDNQSYGQVPLPSDMDSGDSFPAQVGNWNIIYGIRPILKTKWGQTENTVFPYSKYGQYCPNNIAGCVPVAFAQIFSHYGYPSYVEWSDNSGAGYSHINWSRVIDDCIANDGILTETYTHASLSEIAHLCRFLGTAWNSDYSSPDKTSTKSGKAIQWINRNTPLSASSFRKYSGQAITNAIAQRNLVYLKGSTTRTNILFIHIYSGGHAWVIDGYIYASNRDTSTCAAMYHCNWGFHGAGDGYYLNEPFDLNSGPELYGEPLVTSSEIRPYKYNWYSIIQPQ